MHSVPPATLASACHQCPSDAHGLDPEWEQRSPLPLQVARLMALLFSASFYSLRPGGWSPHDVPGNVLLIPAPLVLWLLFQPHVKYILTLSIRQLAQHTADSREEWGWSSGGRGRPRSTGALRDLGGGRRLSLPAARRVQAEPKLLAGCAGFVSISGALGTWMTLSSELVGYDASDA